MTHRASTRRPSSPCTSAGTGVPASPNGDPTVTTTDLIGGDFVDDIAVERCVAGTLPGGAGLNRAERERAVLILHQRGYTNPEITRRVGVSVRAIRPILRRHRPQQTTTVCYQLAVPAGCTPVQARQVRLLIVSRVGDPAEARAVLLALGLVVMVTRPAVEVAT